MKWILLLGMVLGGAGAQSAGTILKVLKDTPELRVLQMSYNLDFDAVFENNAEVQKFNIPTSLQAVTLVNACKNLVMPLLVSPGSAQFNEQFTVAVYPGKRWALLSSVDSQNKMGGLLRSDITCFMRVIGSSFETFVQAKEH